MNNENTQRYQPITPAERDCIPRAVALQLLTDPKCHLSARMRKNCQSSLEKHYVSTHPVRWAITDDVATQPENRDAVLCYDTLCVAKSAATVCTGKMHSVEFSRLHRLFCRITKRINGISHKRTRIMFGALVITERQRNQIMLALLEQQRQLEIFRDCVTAEINRRMKV